MSHGVPRIAWDTYPIAVIGVTEAIRVKIDVFEKNLSVPPNLTTYFRTKPASQVLGRFSTGRTLSRLFLVPMSHTHEFCFSRRFSKIKPGHSAGFVIVP